MTTPRIHDYGLQSYEVNHLTDMYGDRLERMTPGEMDLAIALLAAALTDSYVSPLERYSISQNMLHINVSEAFGDLFMQIDEYCDERQVTGLLAALIGYRSGDLLQSLKLPIRHSVMGVN